MAATMSSAASMTLRRARGGRRGVGGGGEGGGRGAGGPGAVEHGVHEDLVAGAVDEGDVPEELPLPAVARRVCPPPPPRARAARGGFAP